MLKIRKNRIILLIVLLSFLNIIFFQKDDCDIDNKLDCCHSETLIEAEASCCEDGMAQENSFDHQNSFDYCGCFHDENSSNNYLSNTFNSLEELYVTEFKYLTTPPKFYSSQKIYSKYNLLDVPIYLSKQSFII